MVSGSNIYVQSSNFNLNKAQPWAVEKIKVRTKSYRDNGDEY